MRYHSTWVKVRRKRHHLFCIISVQWSLSLRDPRVKAFLTLKTENDTPRSKNATGPLHRSLDYFHDDDLGFCGQKENLAPRCIEEPTCMLSGARSSFSKRDHRERTRSVRLVRISWRRGIGVVQEDHLRHHHRDLRSGIILHAGETRFGNSFPVGFDRRGQP